MTSALLTLAITLGAVGLYLALPAGRQRPGRAVLIVLLGAAAALLSVLMPLTAGAGGRSWFVVLTVIALWASVRVVTHPRPVYSALYFVLMVTATAGMLILMQAEFLAVALVIIYAGAILVTYVFVIMLAQRSGGPPRYDLQAREPLLGCLVGFALLGVLAARLLGPEPAALAAVGPEEAAGTVARVGTLLMTDYVVGIQIAGVLLLASMVGSIAIARRQAVEELSGGEEL